MLLAKQFCYLQMFSPAQESCFLPGTGIWHWKSDFMNKNHNLIWCWKRDPWGSMVVQVDRHICDEVLHNAQTSSDWGNNTRAANVSRFRGWHCAEVLLFDCTTQHSYCCPASTPNTSHSSICLACWGTFFPEKKNDKLFLGFVSKPQTNPKGCKRPQILAKTTSINKHSEPQLNLWEVWCIIALSIGKVLERLYYLHQ